MMRRKEVVEFRTPQHPSLGRNSWGGASPLLARNIPKESLDQRYARLNSVRSRDEVFPVNIVEDGFDWPVVKEPIRRRGLFLPNNIFMVQNKVDHELYLGPKKKSRWSWFPRLDPRNRWPQGWC